MTCSGQRRAPVRAFLLAILAMALQLLVATPSVAMGTPLRLDSTLSAQQRNFEGNLEIYHDDAGILSQEDVASAPYADRFEPLAGAFNGGYTRGAWWIRFRLQSSAQELARPMDGGWWLRLSAPYADAIEVWLPAGAGDRSTTLVHRSLGALQPVATREMPWSLPVVRLPELRDTEAHWVWIKLSGTRALSLIGGVSSLGETAGIQQQITFAAAAVIGMVLLMGVVSMMIGLALPERRFVHFSGYLFTLTLLFFCSENLQASMWLPSHPVASVRLHSLAVCLHTVAAIAFARSLLDMAREFPRLDRAFAVLTYVGCMACVIAVAGGYGLIAPALNLLWMSFGVVMVVLCVVLTRRHVEVWPSLLGYAVYLVVGLLHFAKNLQWLPYTLATQYSYAIGAIVHILAFFFALGWRARHRERRALALSRHHGERLEQRVEERTRDLQQEITQHLCTHERLALTLREQRGLLAMVSHEFRTPLGTIGGAAEILAEERFELVQEDVRREASKITRTVLRMRDLVDTLLADEWLESSSQSLRKNVVDLEVLLRDKVDEHNSASALAAIRLTFSGTGLRILADETLLHIALDNLIANAIKYAPARTPVSIWAGYQRDPPVRLADVGTSLGVCIRVSDEGTGFRPEDLARVFERFYRAPEVRRIPGIGLGLHMVYRIAQLHGGSVSASNRPEGGAAVALFLPVSERGERGDGAIDPTSATSDLAPSQTSAATASSNACAAAPKTLAGRKAGWKT